MKTNDFYLKRNESVILNQKRKKSKKNNHENKINHKYIIKSPIK